MLTLPVSVPLQLTAANRQSKLLSQLPDTRALDLGEVDTVAPSAASWTDALHRSSAGESRLSKPYADAGDTAVPEGDPVWNTTAVGELAVYCTVSQTMWQCHGHGATDVLCCPSMSQQASMLDSCSVSCRLLPLQGSAKEFTSALA